jgi:hypothetical protein
MLHIVVDHALIIVCSQRVVRVHISNSYVLDVDLSGGE